MATFLFIATFMLIVFASFVRCPPPSLPKPPFAVVAFEWPMALCTIKHGCNKTPPANLRLHGVWPTHGNGSRMEYCTNHPFSGSALNDIRKDLLYYWPSYYQPENQFWKYEWEKHGTCSGQPVKEYFQNSMTLFTKMYQRIFTTLVRNGKCSEYGTGRTFRSALALSSRANVS
ncbi:ribonuclease 3-like [Spinacia oleracea]|uniref:Ribonuclease 3-like n=1 Tax=Spinacia oleracea TaxID=3562 RepID=A0ABM3R3P7_SPIOL|nr:ribonuclease 3-like [Spinacia oleracea]